MEHLDTKRNIPLSLAALGIVYGDIGTSPLYALRESLHGLPITPVNVLGILSLIFWSLILVISVKYLCIILRADNEGEGGILSLLALLKRQDEKSFRWLLYVGIFGAGLLFGDGMLTPAVSVLSAVEGLKIISPGFSHWVLPLTVLILLALFFNQYHGTERIGRLFGPILLIWFFVLGLLGITHIFENPVVLNAVNPYYALNFFSENHWTGYIVLGGIFLVVTGGEALYADLGHFGKTPIRISWFVVVLPALLLNYFGQGANVLLYPEVIANPFYALAPNGFEFPLLLLATLATIIASQAVISATFSLAKQAILLDFYPRIPILQTSEATRGQIYVAQMNWILAIGTVLLVLTFKNSSTLAHAYGVGVNLEMLALTFMVVGVAYKYWQWPLVKVIAVFAIFVMIDFAFLGANLQKIPTGGWVPLLFATIAAAIMLTWYRGMEFLRSNYYARKGNLVEAFDEISMPPSQHVPDTTAILMTDLYDNSGGVLPNYLKLNYVRPENILIVSICVENYPYVSDENRYEVTKLIDGVHRLRLHYGYMQLIDIPEALAKGRELQAFSFPLHLEEANYLIEIAYVTATTRKPTLTFYWQEKLFAFLMRNAVLDIEFFKLPYDRTIAIGTYCEI